jgi:hypothetical protein
MVPAKFISREAHFLTKEHQMFQREEWYDLEDGWKSRKGQSESCSKNKGDENERARKVTIYVEIIKGPARLLSKQCVFK